MSHLAAQSVWLLVRYFRFEKPFTNEMIRLGIIDQKIKIQLLGVSLFSDLFMFVILSCLCILGANYTRPIGFYVYGIVFVLSLLLFHPTKDRYTWSPYSVMNYAQKHSVCMDMDLFNSFGDSLFYR